MGLQINTNVAALNAYRNLSGTQGSMQTSLERLSSGLRINRAADDAAGLAISEKLRSQVNGLNQAQANAQDGVSLIQTAEGALNEVHSILQRMRTLAVQSTSDTNTNADRDQIQKEVVALTKEVEGISTRTQFNGMNLLDGTFNQAAAKKLQIGANAGQTMDVAIKAMGVVGLNVGTIAGSDMAATSTAAAKGTVAGDGDLGAVTDPTYSLKSGSYTLATNGVLKNEDGETVGSWDGTAASFANGAKIAMTGTWAADDTFTVTAGSPEVKKGDVQPGLNLSTQAGAAAAITTLDNAIKTVSDQRADLGALQNRLDHTIKNLGVSAENLAASESRIRDTDMAKEMTNFTRSQILQQAGVSMLAQANQSSQSVLKLLG